MRRLDTPHGVMTALHIGPMLEAWGTEKVTAGRIAAVLGGHHGYFPHADVVGQAEAEISNHGGPWWQARRDELVLAMVQAMGLPDPGASSWHQVRLGTAASVGLAALTTVSDWIASDSRNYESPTEPFELDAYVRAAQVRAHTAVANAGFEAWLPPPDTRFVALFPVAGPARPVQELAERLVEACRQPSVMLVEAPTGEGKSKLALQVAATMVRSLDSGGVYVGMPTKATSNNMLAEVEQLLAALDDDTTVRLIHSDARAFLADRTTEPSDVGRDDPEDSDVSAREWFTRKKSLLTNLGVGTVDQVAKAAIRSGHVFVRLAALSNKVVILDEIHAYDLHLSTLLDRLLMWLGRLGASVVLLSATLPSRRRQELLAAWQSGNLGRPPRDTPPVPHTGAYPRITVVGGDEPVVRGAATSDLNRSRDVQLDKTIRDEDVATWTLAKATAGCVAVVHNMVSRAKATADSLRDRVASLPASQRPEIVLIHGQLDPARRQAKEEWLRRYLGPRGERVNAIVVGTQVLEQSLDLDFDAMLTDLAPVDLLIQRAGRVHRHHRDDRGGLLLGITGVEETVDGPRFPRYVGNVYSHYVLLRTWALIRNTDVLACPDAVPAMVDAVYGPDEAIPCPSGWESAWHKAQAVDRRRSLRTRRDAQDLHLPMPLEPVRLHQVTGESRNPGSTRGGRRRT